LIFSIAMLALHSSLVKYDQPILVSSTKESRGKGKKVVPDEKQAMSPTVEILNSILPPREWTEDGQLWVQYVSSTPATKTDVVALQEHLDQKLQQRQARETGICPIREELYAQCFDELIRQITINCQERGLLLLRVRDEIRMTIACYQTLYESSIAFGMRKALQSEQNKVEMQTKIKVLETEKRELERQLQETKNRCELFEKREREHLSSEQAKHAAEMETLRANNARLRRDLEQMLSVPATSAFAMALPKES